MQTHWAVRWLHISTCVFVSIVTLWEATFWLWKHVSVAFDAVLNFLWHQQPQKNNINWHFMFFASFRLWNVCVCSGLRKLVGFWTINLFSLHHENEMWRWQDNKNYVRNARKTLSPALDLDLNKFSSWLMYWDLIICYLHITDPCKQFRRKNTLNKKKITFRFHHRQSPLVSAKKWNCVWDESRSVINR